MPQGNGHHFILSMIFSFYEPGNIENLLRPPQVATAGLGSVLFLYER
jgi:hypothetical protein